MKNENIKSVKVLYRSREVGILSCTLNGLAAFQYSEEWLDSGFSISPLSLPLDDRVFIADREPFYGLFGVFNDSLPDGWGRLLVDRYLQKCGIDPGTVGFLYRLTLLSSNSMGALEYEPVNILNDENALLDFDHLKIEFDKILNSKEVDDIDRYFLLAGSSGGARPKAHMTINGKEWIVKFPSSYDRADAGKMEYDYSLAAKECGIDMSSTRLFPSSITSGYFGTERFDRSESGRVHVLSASGLLETSHRYPVMDYEHLFKASLFLSGDALDIQKIFTLMCFNVYAHNMDDHAKNFSFVYTDEGRWRFAPAYDLTYSSSFPGEHATTICRNGRPDDSDILSLGRKYLRENDARRIMNNTKEIVNTKLSEYLKK